jgi:hypothetical protein
MLTLRTTTVKVAVGFVCGSRSPVDLPTAVMVTSNRTDLPAARTRKHTTASLTRDQKRQVTSDFRTCPAKPIRRKSQTNA